MSKSIKLPKFVSDPSADDDIYIDCKPVEVNNETSDEVFNQDDGNFNQEVLKDLTREEINIFQNPGIKSILAAGIFAIILFSGNYIFNKLPNSKLQKAIDRERYS